MNKVNKVVINSCYGGFSLSPAAIARLAQVGVEASEFSPGCQRHDPRLVRVVEELGRAADGEAARLTVETVEENEYIIREYDGLESITTPSMIRWTKVGGE